MGRPSRTSIPCALILALAACEGSTVATTNGGAGNGGGGAGGDGGGGAGGEMLVCVIDGVLGAGEQCDDGNAIDGDGCDNDCSFTCTKGTVNGDAKCTDGDPCNGDETCTDQHTCQAGVPAADGTPCGAGKICKGTVCGDDVCGDAFTSAAEDCDDGNTNAGDGCENDCTFSCSSSDPMACTPADPCAGQGSCDDATHTCSPGVPLADGAPCGAGAFCLAGACKSATCPDGTVDPGEACDDGNAIDGDGCDSDCQPSCVDPAIDCPAAPACNAAACDAQDVCTVVPDPSQDGQPCGMGFVCNAGGCAAPSAVCGNGIVEAGEACDFGMQNGPGAGCETNCTFSCTTNPNSCDDANPCNGAEVCSPVMVAGGVGQACFTGGAPPACSACPGGVCLAGACGASTCGDGCVDAGTGEECEPPGTPTCDALCQTVTQPVCGNGVLEAGEQCDDANTTNLDACDAVCDFEQDQRVNYLKMQFGVDAYCTANQLGAAITGGTAQGQLQQALDDGVLDGSVTILFKMLGLDDLTGTSDPMVSVGVLNGSPMLPMGAPAYDGTNDLDWWYLVDPLSIDANRNPLTSLSGSINAKVLTAGPGTVTLSLILGGSPAPLKMSATKVTGTVGATSAPLASAGLPPGHLAAEHLDPALTSYATVGQKNANGSAKLCGNVSAASLKNVPIPMALVGGGLFACSQNYQATNSLLDVLIGGCNILFIQQIKPTQPDQVDPSVPQPGAGGPYVLQANAQKVVSTCRDKNNVVVNLQQCLDAAAYSSFFKFATDRVIVK